MCYGTQIPEKNRNVASDVRLCLGEEPLTLVYHHSNIYAYVMYGLYAYVLQNVFACMKRNDVREEMSYRFLSL